MRTAGTVFWLVAALAAAAAAVWAFSPRPVAVELAAVSRGRFEQTVDDDGRTRVRERYLVSAPLAGHLLRIGLTAGDDVARGQTVAAILPNPPALLDARTLHELEARVAAAQALVRRAQALHERASASLEQALADEARTLRLAEQGFVAPAAREQASLTVRQKRKELEAARFEIDAAAHDLAQARAALGRMRADSREGAHAHETFEVRSPIDGRVLRVAQESESAVAVGAPLLEIGDLGRLEIVVDVLSTDAVGIPAGARVYVDAGGAHAPLEGRVRRVEPSAFTKISALGVEEQRVNVVIDLVSDRAAWDMLGDGYRVDARIVVFAVEAALLVPTGALFRDGEGFAAFVEEGGVAHKRAMHVLRRNEVHALAEGGVRPGERVVMYPGDAVRDGVRVVPRGR